MEWLDSAGQVTDTVDLAQVNPLGAIWLDEKYTVYESSSHIRLLVVTDTAQHLIAEAEIA